MTLDFQLLGLLLPSYLTNKCEHLTLSFFLALICCWSNSVAEEVADKCSLNPGNNTIWAEVKEGGESHKDSWVEWL